MRAEAALDSARADLADLEAVERTLDRIDRLPEAVTTRKVLRMVYMDRPREPMEPGDVSQRIVRASLAVPTSERTVHRLLAKARRVFAEERGLRTS